MSTVPTSPSEGLSSRQPGLREAMFLAIAGGFTSLMMDFHEGAVICGFAAVALWLVGWLTGRRPTPLSTVVCGAGLVVTTVWWPREFWWQAAITLLWIGVAMIAFGIGHMLVQRLTGHSR